MTTIIAGILIECFGISLGIIEARFTPVADALEKWIDDSEQIMMSHGQRLSKTLWFQLVFAASILLVLTLGTWYLLGNFSPMIDPLILHWSIWVLFWIIVSASTVVVGLYLLAELVDFLNVFSGGKATLSLGIIIALIGLTLEVAGLINYFL